MLRFIIYLTITLTTFLLTLSGQAQEANWGLLCFGGSGICTPESKTNKSSSIDYSNKSTNKTLFKKINDNTIKLVVQKNQLSSEEKAAIAGESFDAFSPNTITVFIQEQDYILEEELIAHLGLNPNMSLLKAGNYPLEFRDQDVVITLTLTNLN